MKGISKGLWHRCVVSLLAGLVITFTAYAQTGNTDAKSSASNAESIPGLSVLKKTSEGFRAVAKIVGPAVVVIKATETAPAGAGNARGEGEGPGPQDPFWQFFRHFGGPFALPHQAPEMEMALGSGIILDKKGFIVTNNHVVEGASKVVVNLPGDDHVDIPAKVVGTDRLSDLAVIKIETKKDLPTAQWADSDAVEVGDWAIAIGSPFMLTHTVTLGIVSAKGRNSSNVMGANYGYQLLQTDAAINPGNSGGPLCTIDAKVMGVNTAIYSKSGGYMGIGFAIPSNLAKDIAATLSRGEKVVRGWMGVAITALSPATKKDLGVTQGVLIHQVQPDSPAEKAGLKPGDVITAVNGKPVKDTTTLQSLVSHYKPGEKVPFQILSYRTKQARTVEVTIGKLPSEQTLAQEENAAPEQNAPDPVGVVVAPTKSHKGVRIAAVQPGSPADEAGLQKGDIITNINRRAINSVQAYRKAVRSAPQLNILARRGNEQIFLTLEVPPQLGR